MVRNRQSPVKIRRQGTVASKLFQAKSSILLYDKGQLTIKYINTSRQLIVLQIEIYAYFGRLVSCLCSCLLPMGLQRINYTVAAGLFVT